MFICVKLQLSFTMSSPYCAFAFPIATLYITCTIYAHFFWNLFLPQATGHHFSIDHRPRKVTHKPFLVLLCLLKLSFFKTDTCFFEKFYITVVFLHFTGFHFSMAIGTMLISAHFSRILSFFTLILSVC